MSSVLQIAPVRKSIIVNATPEHAFEVFTAKIDRWWPKSHSIGTTPVQYSVLEPFVGGRWYTRCQDGSDVVVGHVLVWEPGVQLVVTWEINAAWKPDSRVSYASEVDIRFTADTTGGTRVDLEHRNFERMGEVDGATMRDAVDNGWPGLLQLFSGEISNGS